LGKLQAGQGLIGLNRSFLFSGVPNVVFSLWKVNDKFTSELMIEFYKQVLNGEDYAGALRKAKLHLLKNETTAFPSVWSSFLLIGRLVGVNVEC
jgi:CHAT domain-containing protein